MKKTILALMLLIFCGTAFSGNVGLPAERIALPELQGNYQVCIWDNTAGAWLTTSEQYDHSGTYSFQLPEWNQWYWVGLWDSSTESYAFGKWVGNFITE